MAHASHAPNPRRYLSIACAVTWLMPDGVLGCVEVPADRLGTVWLCLDPDAASADADRADADSGRSERFIGAPHWGEAKLGSGGVLVVGAQADFDPTTVRPLSRDGYARPS